MIRWILPNGRGRVLLMVDNLVDKSELLSALSGELPASLKVFLALLQSNIELEKELSFHRNVNGEGGKTADHSVSL